MCQEMLNACMPSHARIHRGCLEEVQTPHTLKHHKAIGFPRNTGSNPMKFTKLPSQHSMFGHHWPASKMPFKVIKGAKIRNQYNQVPHMTQYTNGKVTNSQLDNVNESQEVGPFPAGNHIAQTNRRIQRHSKHKTEQKHKRSTKDVRPWNGD